MNHTNTNINATAHDIDFQRQYTRLNNAIEGLVLSPSDKAFMDSIDASISTEQFRQMVIDRLATKA